MRGKSEETVCDLKQFLPLRVDASACSPTESSRGLYQTMGAKVLGNHTALPTREFSPDPSQPSAPAHEALPRLTYPSG